MHPHNARYHADSVLHRYLAEYHYDLDDPDAPHPGPDDRPPPEHVVRPPFWAAPVPGHLQHELAPCPRVADLPDDAFDLVWSEADRARTRRPGRAVAIGSSWAHLLRMYGLDDPAEVAAHRGAPARGLTGGLSRTTLFLPHHGLAGAARAAVLAARLPDPDRTTVAVSTAESTVDELVAAYTARGARVIALDLAGSAIAPAGYGPDRLLIRCLAAGVVLSDRISAPLWFAAAVGCRVGILDAPRTDDPVPDGAAGEVADLFGDDPHRRTETARRVLGADLVLGPDELRHLLRWRIR